MHEKTNQRISELKPLIIQFIKFGLVGASNTIISLAVYYAGLAVGMHYLLAHVVGFFVSVTNSFFWNNRFVFKTNEKRSLLKTFIKTVMAYAGTGLVLANILLYVEVDVLGWSNKIAPLLNLLITIPLNFLVNKFWTFRDKK